MFKRWMLHREIGAIIRKLKTIASCHCGCYAFTPGRSALRSDRGRLNSAAVVLQNVLYMTRRDSW